MELYKRKKWWKFFIILGALLIGLFTLLYTNRLVDELKVEEQKKMEIWAEANRQLAVETPVDDSLDLILEILRNNTTVPVIVADEDNNILFHRNIEISQKDSLSALHQQLEIMEQYKEPIIINLPDSSNQYIYYYESTLLQRLQWFPYIQLFVVFVFVSFAYIAFSVSRRWEQDQVWVGMARETAHQLGTPTTSLLGWMEVLEMRDVDKKLVDEMRFDITRLQTITSRFSKIGSAPELKKADVVEVIEGMMRYLQKRSSAKVTFLFEKNGVEECFAGISKPLFEWVIENLCKNAIDAIEGEGTITIKLEQQSDKLSIFISDSGKGMSRNVQNTVFKPGFSTKQRGWGLGLPLAKRIVEKYHKGKIDIAYTAPEKGTIFRITIPLNLYND
ncbi:HAMP domain-containing sensor histidine kinase [Marinilabiliaceae bacterium ANBcel2]|nr:HAMP domain-containing sensor histidine kinase [Marinilabiliaceae bacterium ANBcel2]